MKGFQVGVLIFFGLFVFLGVLIFSGAIKIGGGGGGSSASTTVTPGAITIWGTISKKNLNTSINYLAKNKGLSIIYVEKDPRTYQEDILHAFAFGGLPDLFILSQDLVYTYKDKILNIPFTYFAESTYDSSYIRAANIFKDGTGFLGFPIFADPLVLYYNQDLLETAGFTEAPKYWSDLFDYVPKLVSKNEALEIKTAAVALGEFTNINNAKEVMSALLLQLNDPIVYKDAKGAYQSALARPSDVSTKPTAQSINFYKEFADPLKNVYTWNKSLKTSQDEFISGDLAMYFGLTSEFYNIKKKNPNLNFNVAMLPQVKELNNSITYADMYALAIPKNSPSAQVALSIAADLANGSNTLALVAPSGFAPVRRDLIAAPEVSKYNKVFYNSALNARSWIDPDDKKTTEIFSNMIENVTSGLSTVTQAVGDADTELRALLTN